MLKGRYDFTSHIHDGNRLLSKLGTYGFHLNGISDSKEFCKKSIKSLSCILIYQQRVPFLEEYDDRQQLF